MKPLSGHVTSGASTAQIESVDLEAVFEFQDAYLQPLWIFDNVIGMLVEVWSTSLDQSQTKPIQ
jgi:hypothetical protein